MVSDPSTSYKSKASRISVFCSSVNILGREPAGHFSVPSASDERLT